MRASALKIKVKTVNMSLVLLSVQAREGNRVGWKNSDDTTYVLQTRLD